MRELLLAALGLTSLLAIGLKRTYSSASLRNLKKRARQGDKNSANLIKAVGYGTDLQLLLWLWIIITSASFFVAVSNYASPLLAITLSSIMILIGFVWLPQAQSSFIGRFIAAKLAPVLGHVINYLHPITSRLVRLGSRLSKNPRHSGLHDKTDVINLLRKQQSQTDNPVEKTELEMAANVLKIGDLNISEQMMPWRKFKKVSPDDALGPVLMAELHGSGQAAFPVYDKNQKTIVGTLFLHDLLRNESGGTVAELMKPEVYFLHEDQTLSDALQAILSTHRHLFIVVNNQADYVGVITSQSVFETIFGGSLFDDFDRYHDPKSVIDREANRLLEANLELNSVSESGEDQEILDQEPALAEIIHRTDQPPKEPSEES